MRPPTTQAVQTALAILLASINDENGTDFTCDRSATFGTPLQTDTIDRTVEALRLAQEELSIEAGTRIGAAYKQRNTVALFSRLPVELMVEIFHDVLLRREPKSIETVLKTLARVSVRWWDIVSSSPSLWSTIESGHGYTCGWAAMALRKSGDRSLIIKLEDPSDHPEADNKLVEKVGMNAHRWQSLSVGYRAFMGVLSYLDRPAPRLESFRINAYDMRQANSRFVALAGGPLLRAVEVSQVRLPWTSGALSGLHYLTIAHIHDFPPFLHEISSILLSCPALKVLVLRNLSKRGPRSSFAGEQAIFLPHLHELVIEGLPAELMANLLRLIHVEKLNELRLVSQLLGGSMIYSSLIDSNEKSSVASVLFRNFWMKGLRVSLLSGSLQITGTRDNYYGTGVHIELQDSWMLETFTTEPYLPLDSFSVPVHMILSHFPSDPSFLRYVPSLVSLDFDSNISLPISVGLLAYLSHPQRHPDGTMQLPSPMLQKLRLRGARQHLPDSDVLGAIGDMLKSRRQIEGQGGPPGRMPGQLLAQELKVLNEVGRVFHERSGIFV